MINVQNLSMFPAVLLSIEGIRSQIAEATGHPL